MAYTKKKREIFIQMFRKTLGNVTITCRNTGIDRKTYYKWIAKYPDFKEECEYIRNEETGDFCEAALQKRIEAGDTVAIIFTLKTRFKDRGYVERQELTGAEGRDLVLPKLTEEDIEIIKKANGL